MTCGCAAATARIKVCNTPGANAYAVAEYALAMIINTARNTSSGSRSDQAQGMGFSGGIYRNERAQDRRYCCFGKYRLELGQAFTSIRLPSAGP